jgi:hypothetical protein
VRGRRTGGSPGSPVKPPLQPLAAMGSKRLFEDIREAADRAEAAAIASEERNLKARTILVETLFLVRLRNLTDDSLQRVEDDIRKALAILTPSSSSPQEARDLPGLGVANMAPASPASCQDAQAPGSSSQALLCVSQDETVPAEGLPVATVLGDYTATVVEISPTQPF